MANDRLYLKCINCGKTGLLAKYYPGGISHGVWFPDRLNDFIHRHMKCSPNFNGLNLKGDRCFDVYAESDPRSNELDNFEKEIEDG